MRKSTKETQTISQEYSRTTQKGAEYLPYDAVVVAVLIAAEATGALTRESDGGNENHATGRRLAEGNE